MNKFTALTWTLLKSSYSPLVTGKYNRMKTAGLLLLIGISLLPMVAGFSMLVSKLYGPLAAIGQQGTLLALGCALSGVLILIFGIFYVINIYYFAQDVEFLLPLPLRPADILGAKFLVTLIFEYLTQLIILGPLLVTWGRMSGGDANYYLLAAVVFLALPVIPLVVASLLAMLLMSYTSIARHKDRFRIWAGGLSLLAAFGAQYFMQKTMATTKTDDLVAMLQQGQNSLIDLAVRLFPGVKFAVLGMLQQGAAAGWGYMLLFLGLTLFFLLLLRLVGGLIYFRGAIGGSESYAPHRRLSSAELTESSRPAAPLRTLMLKELRLLVRTPAYFMNCVLVNFIWPVMFIFMGTAGSGDGMEGVGKLFGSQLHPGMGLLIAMGAALLITGSGGASASGISREGSLFFVSKYLPVSYTLQLKAKMAVAFLLALAGFIVLVAALAWLFPIPPLLIALAPLAAIPAIALAVLFGMIIDIHYPRLVWDNEYRAVKNNSSVVALLLAAGAVGAGCIWAAVKYQALGWTPLVVALLLIIAADILLYWLLENKSTHWLSAIDV